MCDKLNVIDNFKSGKRLLCGGRFKLDIFKCYLQNFFSMKSWRKCFLITYSSWWIMNK